MAVKKRKKKRKLHKGRFALLLLIVAVVIIIIMAIVSRACSEELGIRYGGDFRRPVAEAVQAGRRDADAVLNTTQGSFERQQALLEIRAREYRLRQSGHAHAADDYLNSATDHLKTHGVDLR